MTLALREGVLLAETEDGISLLDEDSGQYWNLNPTAALVLRTLLEGGTPEQAAVALTKEYRADLDSANRDVQELLQALDSAALLRHQM